MTVENRCPTCDRPHATAADDLPPFPARAKHKNHCRICDEWVAAPARGVPRPAAHETCRSIFNAERAAHPEARADVCFVQLRSYLDVDAHDACRKRAVDWRTRALEAERRAVFGNWNVLLQTPAGELYIEWGEDGSVSAGFAGGPFVALPRAAAGQDPING